MAIKVSGTTVVDDSRNLTNVVNTTLSGTITTVKIAETLVAIGNTSTAANINLAAGTVFTATANANTTLTITNPTGAAAFTLILTNGHVAGNTVAWAGGTFRFPGGNTSISRTTIAAGVDIWSFFSPDGGTTWYGNITMSNLAA